jgi:predicted GTPase
MFQDYGRYAEIIASTRDEPDPDRASWHSEWSQSQVQDKRTPSLVSFVGQSGAGKSTLINLLVTLKGGREWKSPAPVVGMAGKDVPTSEVIKSLLLKLSLLIMYF